MASPEQEPAPQANHWDIEGAARALNIAHSTVEDFYCGAGVRLHIRKTATNPPGQLDLYPDAFPDAGLARLRNQSFQLDMRVVIFTRKIYNNF